VTWSAAPSWSAAPEDTFPIWQFEGGKKHKWTNYDAYSQEQLEHAFANNIARVELVIDNWPYTVELTDNMTQISGISGARRRVRRLSEAALKEAD
jgi:hypothetical protein